MKKSGTTLIELLVVLIVLSTLLTISTAAISSLTSPKQQLRKEARSILKLLQKTRTAAITQNREIEVRVDAGANRVYTQQVGYIEPSDSLFDDGVTETNTCDLSVDVSDSITVSSVIAGSTNEWVAPETALGFDGFDGMETSAVTAITFTRFGSTAGGGIRLGKERASLELMCDVLTGRASVRKKRSAE